MNGMAYLLDTCTLLWALEEPDRLGARARNLICREAEVYASPVNAWEIQVKYSIGKLGLKRPPREWWETEIEKRGFIELPLVPSAVFLLAGLPDFHRDPFDRMLVCQALHQGLTLLTPDPLVRQYPVSFLWD